MEIVTSKHVKKPNGEKESITYFGEDDLPIEVVNWFSNLAENNIIRVPNLGLRIAIYKEEFELWVLVNN